ncbi:hypothetical protein F5J12DRAFT_896078 [Pisolithus orientalis]|uniref:uncharacterized protein n=1 Tax=Pisolithus orientalis TaxID=936130 RepID=UPI00222543C1|nr:uncharacterized protein F5J12DRAFT_896078 [Pisolithus orientalis]KAI5996547.1 hypothetical protein F5J12DRAFT_896078 [Pisolithus orientalis]
MSELDADLYGDLYGNDEADFTAAVELNETKADIQKPSETSTETPASTVSPRTEPRQEPLSSSIAAPRPKSEPTTQPTYQPIPTHSSPISYSSAPQQIPTYQQPQPSDGLKLDPPHIPERSIRPSEMKDEGPSVVAAAVATCGVVSKKLLAHQSTSSVVGHVVVTPSYSALSTKTRLALPYPLPYV